MASMVTPLKPPKSCGTLNMVNLIFFQQYAVVVVADAGSRGLIKKKIF